MRILCLVLMMVIFMATGCSAEPKIITGTVVDAETGSPIEGAVVLVEWTKAEGVPGLASTKSDKVVEVITDKDGQFTVEDVKKLLIGQPDVAVYKKGYVTWSSRWVFPDRQNRTDFKWRSGNIYKLDKFKDTYSYVDHQGFTMSAVNSTIGGPNDKQLFLRTYSDVEEKQVILELSEREKKKRRRP
ncbi:MAG: carboxypeptidase regulatory-like domain-containing protein [Nitrospirae bacterium]|nr:carboxypeptidase regulatory-like domain-containing protein [Nitrospirota bacterium]